MAKKQREDDNQGKDKPRAGHKEGSVYYWEQRDCWVAQITLETGKRKRVS